MESHQQAIERMINEYRAISKAVPVPVRLFDAIASGMQSIDGFRIDNVATQAARQLAPNVIVVFGEDESQKYAKLEYGGRVSIGVFTKPNCDTYLLSKPEALLRYFEEGYSLTQDDLEKLRFVVSKGVMCYDLNDIEAVYTEKIETRQEALKASMAQEGNNPRIIDIGPTYLASHGSWLKWRKSIDQSGSCCSPNAHRTG